MEETVAALLPELRGKEVIEAQGDIGILAGIVTDYRRLHLGHRTLLLAVPDEFLDVDGLIVEIGLGQIVHAVAHLWMEQIVGYHRVEHRAAQLDVIVAEHLEVVFQVLPHLEDLHVLIDGAEVIDHLLGAAGHIPCLAFLDGEGETHELRRQRVGAGGLRVEAYLWCREQAFRQLQSFLAGLHEVVGVGPLSEGGETPYCLGLRRSVLHRLQEHALGRPGACSSVGCCIEVGEEVALERLRAGCCGGRALDLLAAHQRAEL